MYKYCDSDDAYFSLHDCFAEKIQVEKDMVSFVFPDGFWVAAQHAQNHSDSTVRTDSSQVDFQMADGTVDGMTVYLFFKAGEKTIREEWEPVRLIEAVNTGDFRIEFIAQYQGYRSCLFQCWVWFEEEPYHSECEIILDSEHVLYRWNELRYDRTW